ncbi:hypothetical protein [uncultured Maritimibacter sp.]|jgi:hypothetical protein|uniref:hypothetical protein n=1 Tax=uncultured Maritimibacter sp. TaxID=991866 RepID=UPI002613ACB9|nr:hypothetical protein [uncultured Maritimibacter sp.]
MMPKDTYIADDTYAALKGALLHLAAHAESTHDLETELIRVLGEEGGIWPECVMDEAT